MEINDLQINTNESKMTKFGDSGPPASDDKFMLAGQQVEKVRHFPYLGLELTDRSISFPRHTSERVRKARAAFWSIPNPSSLSMSTAIKLFELKVAPIASYGIQITWKHLTTAQLVTLDS